MKQFEITSKESGLYFGIYKAKSRTAVRDKFAKIVGYKNYLDLLKNVPNARKDELLIKQL